MTQLEGDQVDQLHEAVAARLPATWPQWGGGWPYEIEAALIDAVLSIRNRYGKSPTSGVRGSVTRHRNKRAMPADDLEHLERQDPVALASVLGIPFDPGERPCPGDWFPRRRALACTQSDPEIAVGGRQGLGGSLTGGAQDLAMANPRNMPTMRPAPPAPMVAHVPACAAAVVAA